MTDFIISDKLRSNYDGYYDGTSPWRGQGALDKVANIQKLCEPVPHKTVLEIGTGDGSILSKLSEASFADRFCALDVSRSAIDTVKARDIPNLEECSLFDGYRVPYDDKAFDLTILSHVVEHLEYPRMLLSEAARVSRHVYVEVPLELTRRLPRDYVWDKTGHINYYSPKTIRHLLQTTDLQVIDEMVTNNSRALYEIRLGKKGWLVHALKQALLTVTPGLATAIFTYNGSLLCKPVGESAP